MEHGRLAMYHATFHPVPGEPTAAASSGHGGRRLQAPAPRCECTPFPFASRRAAACPPGYARHASCPLSRAGYTGCPLLGLGRRRRPAPALAAPPAAHARVRGVRARAVRAARRRRRPAFGNRPCVPPPAVGESPAIGAASSRRIALRPGVARVRYAACCARSVRPLRVRTAAALPAPLQRLPASASHASRRLPMAAIFHPDAMEAI